VACAGLTVLIGPKLMWGGIMGWAYAPKCNPNKRHPIKLVKVVHASGVSPHRYSGAYAPVETAACKLIFFLPLFLDYNR